VRLVPSRGAAIVDYSSDGHHSGEKGGLWDARSLAVTTVLVIEGPPSV